MTIKKVDNHKFNKKGSKYQKYGFGSISNSKDLVLNFV